MGLLDPALHHCKAENVTAYSFLEIVVLSLCPQTESEMGASTVSLIPQHVVSITGQLHM